jgi:hypothetical protein
MSAAVRASIERGDSLGYLRHGPVSGGVDPGERIRAANWPTLPAVADEAVADDSHRSDLPLGNVASETDGQHADAVEHLPKLYPHLIYGQGFVMVDEAEHDRRARLSRWQRLPE